MFENDGKMSIRDVQQVTTENELKLTKSPLKFRGDWATVTVV